MLHASFLFLEVCNILCAHLCKPFEEAKMLSKCVGHVHTVTVYSLYCNSIVYIAAMIGFAYEGRSYFILQL